MFQNPASVNVDRYPPLRKGRCAHYLHKTDAETKSNQENNVKNRIKNLKTGKRRI